MPVSLAEYSLRTSGTSSLSTLPVQNRRSVWHNLLDKKSPQTVANSANHSTMVNLIGEKNCPAVGHRRTIATTIVSKHLENSSR